MCKTCPPKPTKTLRILKASEESPLSWPTLWQGREAKCISFWTEINFIWNLTVGIIEPCALSLCKTNSPVSSLCSQKGQGTQHKHALIPAGRCRALSPVAQSSPFFRPFEVNALLCGTGSCPARGGLVSTRTSKAAHVPAREILQSSITNSSDLRHDYRQNLYSTFKSSSCSILQYNDL